MAEAFVYDHLRTPRGKGKAAGSLHEVKPIDLIVGLLDEVKKRNPSLDPARVDDVVLGVVSPVGEQGGGCGAIARGIGGLRSDFAHHLGAHILELVLEFDLLRHCDAVLGDARGPKGLVEHDVTTLRS